MQRRPAPSKVKVTVKLSRFIVDQLNLACKDPSKNKSQLTEKALQMLLDPERESLRDGGMERRLNAISTRVLQIDRHQDILLESVGLLVRYFLTVTPSLQKSEQDAARLKGNQRFESFVAQLGKRIASSQRLTSEVMDRVNIHDPDLKAGDLEGGPASPPMSRGKQAPAHPKPRAASSLKDDGMWAVPGSPAEILDENS